MTPALRGVLPVAPTVFHDDESLDLDGQRKVTEFLIDAGAAAVCVLANYSEHRGSAQDDWPCGYRSAIGIAQAEGRSSSELRVIAASIRDRCVKACGKLPICSPVRPISSEYRPR
jgi:hypothetical protein